jgi:hypothetical protein
MKTAISIPEDILRASEKIAKKLKISRSAVFALGAERLRDDLDREAITARINNVCRDVDTSLDPDIAEYTVRTLRAVEW